MNSFIFYALLIYLFIVDLLALLYFWFLLKISMWLTEWLIEQFKTKELCMFVVLTYLGKQTLMTILRNYEPTQRGSKYDF
jgi:hypothetical protein